MRDTANLSELTLRWISALCLIPFGLFVVWSGGYILLLACSAFAGVMAYEWSVMGGLRHPRFVGAWAFLSLFSLLIFPPYVPLLCVVLGSLINAYFERPKPIYFEGFNGLAYAMALAWSLYMLRVGPWDGLTAALILMPIVWASDAGAFFVGKQIGGPPLSRTYSPKKTWSGAFGSVAVCAICGIFAAYLLSAPYLYWVGAAVFVSISAQAGDLFESIQKRRLNAKDASSIIPGHGGVMDRVDGLGAMCFFFVVIFILFPGLPAILGLA